MESELWLVEDGGKLKEFYFVSDVSVVVEYIKRVMVIEDNEVVYI